MGAPQCSIIDGWFVIEIDSDARGARARHEMLLSNQRERRGGRTDRAEYVAAAKV